MTAIERARLVDTASRIESSCSVREHYDYSAWDSNNAANTSIDLVVTAVGITSWIPLTATDLLGTSQHFTIPVGKLDEGVFDDGLGFDGSSIRGWQGMGAMR